VDRSYVNELMDWVKWYNEWRPRMENAPLEQKVNWLMKANLGCIGLLAGLADQVVLVEQGEKGRKQQILLPVGVRWHG